MRNDHFNTARSRMCSLLIALLAATVTANLAVASQDSAGQIDPASMAALQRDLELNPEDLRQRSVAEHAAMALKQTLRDALGSTFGGAWLIPDEENGVSLVVAATDAYGIAQVRAAGATPKLVLHSLERLRKIRQQLDDHSTTEAPPDSIAAWYVDPPTNKVVVEIVASEQIAMESSINFVVRSGIDMRMVRLEYVQERPQPTPDTRGGDHYVNTSQGLSCSMGFSVHKFVYFPVQWDRQGFVTAGHCGEWEDAVEVNGTKFGGFHNSQFPQRDSALVLLNGSLPFTPRPWVNNYSGGNVIVRGKQEALVGAAVCRSGYATGYRCGTIVTKNVTVNYPQGTVYDLTQIDACVGFGDSGGAVITPAGQAQGVTSGGQIPTGQSNNCSSSTPVTYIEPYSKVLSVVGFVVLLVE